MSSTILLSVKKAIGVKFDDFDAMNAELSNNPGVAELLDYPQVPQGSLFLQKTENGFLWMDRERGQYAAHANVYYCWSEDAMQVIANHMTSGKLVLSVAAYGSDTEYYRLTPCLVEELEIE